MAPLLTLKSKLMARSSLLGGGGSRINEVLHLKLALLNSDGSVDGNFDPKPSSNVLSIATLANGQIIVGGSFGTIGGSVGFLRNRLAKLNSDGTVDASYNPNVNADVEVIAVQADGKILIGGSFTEVGGIDRNRIARLNVDGSVDSSFEPNSNRRVKTIALTLNGDILIGGGPTIVGTYQKRLACGLTG